MRSVWLMYHDVYRTAPAAGVPITANAYHVSLTVFESHLDAIARSGLPVLSVSEYLSRPAAHDSVVMTFDDGWQGAFEIAAPLLRQRGWKATCYVTRDFIGRKNFCTPVMLRNAAASGIEIGSHGVTHRMLSACSHDQAVEEFVGCRKYLQDLLGLPADHASIPGGDLTPAVVECARQAGVASLANSRPGINLPSTRLFDLNRVAMKNSTSVEDVERFCQFSLGRERARWALLQMPRGLLGMKRYSQLRRLILKKDDPATIELFQP